MTDLCFHAATAPVFYMRIESTASFTSLFGGNLVDGLQPAITNAKYFAAKIKKFGDFFFCHHILEHSWGLPGTSPTDFMKCWSNFVGF